MAIGDGVSALAMLGVTFGGFSPTAMDGVEASREYIERVEVENARKKKLAKRKRELEMARTSKPKTFIDETDTQWTYVIIDGETVRIESGAGESKRLEIPAEIEEKPVLALAPDALAGNEFVEEIICPEGLEFIGACAFRWCPNLRRVVFPQIVSEYAASWLYQCDSLEELVLPGMLDKITLSVLENRSLKSLVIGKNVSEIEPGAFQNTQLESVTIDDGNPFVVTDGEAIYTKDYSRMLALALPVSRYAVQDGCVQIGKKAFYGIEALREVDMPESLEVFEPFAFSHTGLRSFKTPPSLKVIHEKSFYYCRQLGEVSLNEGLLEIGNSAFEETALAELRIPASIESIGTAITARSRIMHSGPQRSISIDQAAKALFIDDSGGLYRREYDGIHLIHLMDAEAESFSVSEGTYAIDEYAIARHECIRRVVLPEGVVKVSDNAFRFSQKLEQVDLPDSVEFIGNDAFLDTALESLRIPACLEHLGQNAFVTKGAHRGEEAPSLREIEVSPENHQFFMDQGMLCRHASDGDHVVIFTSSEPHVEIEGDIVGIDAYAFNNARGIEYLMLGKNIRTISTCGLATWCWIERIHVELKEPMEGRTVFDFEFPNTPKSVHGISTGVGGATWVNVPGIYAQYDMCIATAHDYNAPRNPDNVSAYEQAVRILDRLRDPIMLTSFNRGVFERILRLNIIDICVDVARHDDREVIDQLTELGFVNEENLEDIIMAVGKLQDAAMTGYLLEMKRLRFNRAAFDFDL